MQLRASAFAQVTGASAKNSHNFLRRIFLVTRARIGVGGHVSGVSRVCVLCCAHTLCAVSQMSAEASSPSKKEREGAKSLYDWLVEEGHLSKHDGGKGSLAAMATVPAHVDSKLAQAMTRLMQLVDRIPYAAVKNKKQDFWVAYSHRIVEAESPQRLTVELKWFSEQLVSKVVQAPWLANAKGAWEVSCDRVSALKDFYMVLMELEDDAINWKAVNSRWAATSARAQDRDAAASGHEGRRAKSHKKKQKKDLAVEEGPCPLPVPVPQAVARLPEGWKIEVKSATVWRPEVSCREEVLEGM
jgi:hypothetical protein